MLGSLPTTVTVWGSRHVHPEHEDVAYIRLDYGDLGVRSNIHVSWLDPRKVRRITAVGSKKMVVYDDMADEERIRVYDKSASPPEGSDAPLSGIAYHLGEMVAPYVPFAEPLAVQDQHFVDCIANGSPPVRGREKRPGRRPDPRMRSDLASGAAPGGAGGSDTTARRLARRARRPARQDLRWLTERAWPMRQRGNPRDESVPFTDLGVMAGEVWPEIEQEYLACLLERRLHWRPGGHGLRAEGGPTTAARVMPSASPAEPTPWSSA